LPAIIGVEYGNQFDPMRGFLEAEQRQLPAMKT